MATAACTTVELSEVGKAAAANGAKPTSFLKGRIKGKLKTYEFADTGGIVLGSVQINANYTISNVTVTYA